MGRTGAALVAVGAVATLTLAGCGERTEVRGDTQRYPMNGSTLRIDTREAELRIQEGDGDQVTVERTLVGSANDPGRATEEMRGGVLTLGVECVGLNLACSARHTVTVPAGTWVELGGEGSPVHAVGLSGALSGGLSTDGALTVEEPRGDLDLLVRGGNLSVTGARSPRVKARATTDGSISLAFAAAPESVDARASGGGTVEVTLPTVASGYRLDADRNAGDMASDPASSRVISVHSDEGRTAVSKGA